MKELPRFECYGCNKPDNYGMNSLKFYTSEGTFWFSYATLVAFKKLGQETACRENVWGSTTGGHLNAIMPDKSERVSAAEFQRLYQEAFEGAE